MYVSVPSSDISGHWPYEDGPLANNSGSKPNSREHERSWQAVQICDVMFLALLVLPKSSFCPTIAKNIRAVSRQPNLLGRGRRHEGADWLISLGLYLANSRNDADYTKARALLEHFARFDRVVGSGSLARCRR